MSKQEFKNLTEVAAYLKEQGWKVSQRTVYRHGKEGLILPEKNGKYSRKAVEKYTRFLKLKRTDEKKKTDELREEAAAFKRDKERLELELLNIKVMKERGELMTRED